MNSRAFRLAPLRSARVSAVQWTTGTPAARAAASQLGAVLHDAAFFASAASMGNADSSPTTPFWTSCSTSAV